MSANEQDIVERLSAGFEALGLSGVVSVHLFGSVAGGRDHRQSDVDVAVLLDRGVHPSPRGRFEVRVRLAGELPAALARPVDVVILNDAPPLFGRRILAEGRLILCHDAELLHAFTRDVQLRAADLQPFLDRMSRIKLAALTR